MYLSPSLSSQKVTDFQMSKFAIRHQRRLILSGKLVRREPQLGEGKLDQWPETRTQRNMLMLFITVQ